MTCKARYNVLKLGKYPRAGCSTSTYSRITRQTSKFNKENRMPNVFSAVNQFRRIIWVVIIALGLFAILMISTGQHVYSQGNTVREVGADAYQYAGRIDQDGANFIGYGYIYDMQGLAPSALFSNPFNPSETTAHFTYYATATLTSRAVVTDAVRSIFALDSVGEITFYYQSSPSASFDSPESFANGTPITTISMHFQDILSVQGPNRGISTGNGTFTVVTSEPFTFGEETLRFGRPGIVYQISTFGDALRTDPIIPQSSVLLAGNASRLSFFQTFLPSISR
jgi:hypothetical protein